MKDIYQYILSDYTRCYGRGVHSSRKVIFKALIAMNRGFTYCFWLRMSMRKEGNPFYLFARWKHRRLSRKYSVYIPAGTKIGYGLFIGHDMGIIINPGTIMGNNINLSQFTTIGSNNSTPAVIGDNVYIGPSVCIVEDVHIGNNVTIGAGAVVVKDIPDNATVAGVPAKVISYKDNSRYVHNRWDMTA
jgi:serine O-acetyltransferase